MPIPLVKIVKQIHIPLYLEVYISAVLSRGNILDPYVTSNLLTSRKSNMPFGDDESKVTLWDLLSTNSAMNFNNGVVTCTTYLTHKPFLNKRNTYPIALYSIFNETMKHCKNNNEYQIFIM